MLNVGICDDEMGIRVYLDCIISDYFLEKGLLFEIKKFSTGLELLEHEEMLDILFLDISMPGLDGIETGKRLREKDEKLKITYITAHEQYALEAFQIRAFHYLVKPIDQQRVFDVLDEAMKTMDIENNRAMLKLKGYSFYAHKIIFIEAQNHQYVVHTIGEGNIERKNMVKGSLREIEPLLEKYRFEKVKRGLWINPLLVEAREDEKILMIDGSIITI